MQDYFYTLAEGLDRLIAADEVYLANYAGEQSDFVRFNRSSVRQPGSVCQNFLSLELIKGRKHGQATITLTGARNTDLDLLKDSIATVRDMLSATRDDPHLIYNAEPASSETHHKGRLASQDEAVADVIEIGTGKDLVGIYAAGSIQQGFANSLGQRNWHESESFNFDWSFYHDGDKAAKAAYSGFEWNREELCRRADQTAAHMEVLARQAAALEPGRFRVYLAPAAMHEILSRLNWGGFGLNAQRTGRTPFMKLFDGNAQLSSEVRFAEDITAGVAAGFQSEGFVKPDRICLVYDGLYAGSLVSPRSSAEFNVETNGASAQEMAQSLDMAPGTLKTDEILMALDTGLYISNLWYTNFSDESAGRLTGMTRFATFWVEHGEIVSPIQALRFDDTIYRMFGKNLVGLTKEREFILDPWSYDARATRSMHLPGALIDEMTFTL